MKAFNIVIMVGTSGFSDSGAMQMKLPYILLHLFKSAARIKEIKQSK